MINRMANATFFSKAANEGMSQEFCTNKHENAWIKDKQ